MPAITDESASRPPVRERLLNAARDCFLAHEYHQVTTRAIAEKSWRQRGDDPLLLRQQVRIFRSGRGLNAATALTFALTEQRYN